MATYVELLTGAGERSGCAILVNGAFAKVSTGVGGKHLAIMQAAPLGERVNNVIGAVSADGKVFIACKNRSECRQRFLAKNFEKQ